LSTFKTYLTTKVNYSPDFTPSFATFAASMCRAGIANEDQPPASINRSIGVPFLTACVAQ
jgi:hypothetical protein